MTVEVEGRKIRSLVNCKYLKMLTLKLEGRNLEVLAATVRTFISSGEPVGSRTISRKRRDRLSAATIRNIMADLEEAGYLEQPHTSAGRVPTEKAYRFYVEQVARPDKYVNAGDEQLIRQELARGAAQSPEAILERASHVLALVTRNVGVVVAPTVADTVLQSMHFVLLGERRILVILEPRGAPVRNRVIHVDEEFSQDDLGRIANYLNEHFTGWRLEEARREIVRRLEQERALYDELLQGLATLWRQGLLPADPAIDVYLEGASHLMGRAELENPGVLRDLLRALEEKERLVHLLVRYIQAEDSEHVRKARVIIGLDTDSPMKDFALIGALCTTAEGLAGRVAVLGPQRMQYERVISAVSQVARLLGQAIDERQL